MTIKSKASLRGGVLGVNQVIDVDCLSRRAKRHTVVLPVGAFVQNSTVKYSVGCVGNPGILVGAYFSARTLPIGGTLSITIKAWDRSADAEIALTAAIDPEVAAQTAREGGAFTLAGTNVALDGDDTIEFHVTADNSAIGTAMVDGYIALVFEPTEETTIDM